MRCLLRVAGFDFRGTCVVPRKSKPAGRAPAVLLWSCSYCIGLARSQRAQLFVVVPFLKVTEFAMLGLKTSCGVMLQRLPLLYTPTRTLPPCLMYPLPMDRWTGGSRPGSSPFPATPAPMPNPRLNHLHFHFRVCWALGGRNSTRS